jgi:hypothetical protein
LDLPIDVPFWRGLIEGYPELREFSIKIQEEESLFDKKGE